MAERTDATDTRFCTSCGTPALSDFPFCTECGTQIYRPPEPAPVHVDATRELAPTPTPRRLDPARIRQVKERPPLTQRLGAVAVVLTVVAVGVLVGRAAAAQYLGDPLAAVERLPFETTGVVTIDIFAFRHAERLERLADTLEELIDRTDARETIDNVIELDGGPFDIDGLDDSEFDIDPERDIAPWIGRSTALAVMDAVGDEVDNPFWEGYSIVAVVEARDEHGAVAFVERLIRQADNQVDLEVDDLDVSRGQGWVATDTGDGLVAFAVVDGALLVGSSPEAVEMIAEGPEPGESLRDNEAFQAVTDRLPIDPSIVTYLSGADMADSLRDAGVESDWWDGVAAIGSSATLTDDGIVATSSLSFVDPIDTGFANIDQGAIEQALPSSTVAYAAFGMSPQASEFIQETTRDALGRDVHDALIEIVEDLTGFHLFEDFLDHLGGNMYTAMYETDDRDMEDFIGAPVGFSWSVGVTDVTPVRSAIEDLIAQIEDEAGSSLAIDESGESIIVTDDDSGVGARIAFASEGVVVEMPVGGPADAIGRSGPLSDSAFYRIARERLPLPIALYLDAAAYEEIDEAAGGAMTRISDLIPGLAGGYAIDDHTVTFGFFVAVDY